MVQFFFQLACWSVGLPLTLAVIGAMLRGAYRRFPVLFAYEIAGFLLTVAGLPSYIAYYIYRDPSARIRMGQWNWWNDLLLDPLAYAVVISFIYLAASHLRARRSVLTATIGAATLIAGLSFLVHFNPRLQHGVWMALWNRDLNFFSAIFDLGLWGMLLSTRGRDPRLLLVTGGLGIQFTGEAIGNSMQSIAAMRRFRTLSFAGAFFSTLADLAALYVFWQAFRAQRQKTPAMSRQETGRHFGA
jgi:hypothetical protein